MPNFELTSIIPLLREARWDSITENSEGRRMNSEG